MKKILFIIGMITLVSCGQQTGEQEIRKQIAQYEKEKNELEQKIKDLNEQLKEMKGENGISSQIPVFVKSMQPDTFRHFINANGSVEAVEDAFVSPETNGQIEAIHVDEGDRVTKGQVLVSLKTDILKSNIKEVQTNLELARETYEKQKRLWEDNVGSEMQYLQAKNNKESLEARLQTLKEQLEMSSIKAPFDGVVEEITLKVGELASPGIQILHVVNLSQLKVKAEISEQYIDRVHKGDPIRVTFPSLQKLTRDVRISRKGSVIDEESRTFTIEARISNYDERIKPNQVAVVKINDFEDDNAFVVPSAVIKEDMEGDYIYLAKEEEGQPVASKSYVQTGMSYNNETILMSGVEVGDKVIVSGYTQVSEGSPINIKQPEKVVK